MVGPVTGIFVLCNVTSDKLEQTIDIINYLEKFQRIMPSEKRANLPNLYTV